MKILTIAVIICGGLAFVPVQAQNYDLVILNGRVMDPETGLDAVRNVGMGDNGPQCGPFRLMSTPSVSINSCTVMRYDMRGICNYPATQAVTLVPRPN